MIDAVLNSSHGRTVERIWLLSDLQQSNLTHARFCLTTAVADCRRWQRPLDQIWYLGDAVEGADLALLEQMIQMQEEILNPLGVPIYYVLGNHDFDAWSKAGTHRQPVSLPIWQMIGDNPLWQAADSLESFHYFGEAGPYRVVFFTDHGSFEQGWFTTHGRIRGREDSYPWSAADYRRVWAAAEDRPIITVSHYALPGGNRPAPLLEQLLPLPSRAAVHFYGHSHIGDEVWGREHAHRQISSVEYHAVPQINVSSLENVRGSEIRSVLLEIYEDGSLGLFFRDHLAAAWSQAYMLPLPA